MRKVKPNVATAIYEGIRANKTAKEVAYESGITLGQLRKGASLLNLAFRWDRCGRPADKLNHPMPAKTRVERELRTLADVSTMLVKAIAKRPSKGNEDLMQILSFVRRRRMPPPWDRSVNY